MILEKSKIKIGIVFCAVVVAFAFAHASHAATYYVATTGLDSNPGTEAEPFLTIQYAADLPALAAGDTVIVENGTYADTSTVGGYDYGLYISKSGSAGLPITFQAQNVGGAVLDDGNFSEAGIGIGLAAGVHHISIKNFGIRNFSVSGIRGVSGTAIHDVSISRNHLNLIGRDGLHAEVRKIGINVPAQSYNFTIDSNTLNDIGRGADDCDTDNAISLLGHDHTVTNNIFYNDYAGWMIDVSDDGSVTGSKVIKISNNTFSGVAATLPGSLGQIDVDPNGNGQIDNVIISNNISYGGSTEAFINWSTAAYTVTSVFIRNNLSDTVAIDTGSPAAGITRVNNLLNSDPLFINTGSSDYHLLTGSPAISLAYAADAPNHDLDQESRPQNSGADDGAYEYITLDHTSPVISETVPVTTPTADTTPNYSFTTDEAGTIIYGGDCSSADTTADSGSNTVTFIALAPGAHSNCTVKVRDAVSNDSNVISVTPFTIDTSAPTITIVSGTDTGPVQTDTINLTVSDASTVTVREYGYSSDATCNGSDTYGNAFTSGVNFDIAGNHTDYLCAKATDAAANTGYQLVGQLNTDNTGPVLSFSDNVAVGPVHSDTITAGWGDATVKKWEYDADGICSTNAGDYHKIFSDSMNQTTQANNGSYICLYGEDAPGNKTTLASANDINVDITIPAETDDPTFTINSGTDVGPTKTDTINVTVSDASSIIASEYGFSSDATCNGSDTYGNAFITNVDFTVAGNHTDYLCVMATDQYANTGYQLVGRLNTNTDAAAPWSTADPEGGTYTTAQSVALTCEDEAGGSGCDKIYYTTDGTDPNASSTQYSSPINISASTVLKFFAKDLSGNSEAINTESYVINANATETFNFPRPHLTLGGDSFRLNSKKTYYSATKTFDFEGETEGIPGGEVKIYDGKKLLRTAVISASGKWHKKTIVKKAGLYKISFKYYSSLGVLVKKSGEYKVRVDVDDPEFTDLPLLLRKRAGGLVWWTAKDNDEIAYYKYYLDGKIHKITSQHLYLPQIMRRGYHTLRVRAYDRAGNTASRRVRLTII